MENNNIDRELSWDDQIEKDGADFVLLPEGDYNFEITGFERGRHAGSEKLPPCNKAIIQIKIESPEGIATLNHNLFLHTKTEGMLCAFFTSIGQRKHGEKVTMNWNAVIGSCGKCKLGVKEWINDSGEKKIFNEIKKFYEPEEGAAQTKKFEPGRF